MLKPLRHMLVKLSREVFGCLFYRLCNHKAKIVGDFKFTNSCYILFSRVQKTIALFIEIQFDEVILYVILIKALSVQMFSPFDFTCDALYAEDSCSLSKLFFNFFSGDDRRAWQNLSWAVLRRLLNDTFKFILISFDRGNILLFCLTKLWWLSTHKMLIWQLCSELFLQGCWILRLWLLSLNLYILHLLGKIYF